MIKNENVEGEPAYDETYRRGPVVMRDPMIPKDNTYANLLAPEESTDWLHADPWRVLRIQAEFVDGFGALAELGPAATIFGGHRVLAGPARLAQRSGDGRRHDQSARSGSGTHYRRPQRGR